MLVGTMIGFGGFSSNKKLASKIRVFAALAPVTHLGHMYGLLKIIASGTWLAEVCPFRGLKTGFTTGMENCIE